MNLPTARRCAFSTLLGLPLLPLCGFLVNGPPDVVFAIGATVFVIDVMLLAWLTAVSNVPSAGSPPVAKPFRFTIRDLLCLTLFLFGLTMFIISAFRCEAAERASRPGPLPVLAFRQFVWEQQAGLVCIAIGGLIWVRSALKRPNPLVADTVVAVRGI
jgi:hypothetical protein